MLFALLAMAVWQLGAQGRDDIVAGSDDQGEISAVATIHAYVERVERALALTGEDVGDSPPEG